MQHIAIICSDYPKSKHFYTTIVSLDILNETYRADRESYKLDLALNGIYVIELLSFPDPPKRLSRPEGKGLRHLAFEVDNISMEVERLKSLGVICEPIRIDEYTQKQFTFFEDPDGLPLELYEA